MDEQMANQMQDQLREELLPLTLIPFMISGLVLAALDLRPISPPSYSDLAIIMFALVGAVALTRRGSQRGARWLMVIGTSAIVFLASTWFPDSHAQHAAVVPVVVAAITLGSRANLLVTVVSSAVLVLQAVSPSLSRMGLARLIGDILILWSASFLVWGHQRSQNTLVRWAWQGYRAARTQLGEARNRQMELKQALADLALATRQTARLNEMLTAARREAEDARKAKVEFVANVSHELRTPLNMIIGFSDMILESPEVYSRRLPPALLADVAAISRNSQHLADLVDDVLGLAEADIAHAQLTREWTSIHDIVHEAVEAVGALFDKKGLTLAVEIEAPVPPVHCDHTRIRQVILNLASNAGRFTEEGGCTIRVSAENGTLTVSVTDTGPGMPPERLNRMFEPFQQGDPSMRRRYGGTGLGLAISKHFVELHGGRIWLDSAVGAGTTACFTLPLDSNGPLSGESSDGSRWFGPYQQYSPRTRRSLAPSISPKPRIAVLEGGTAVSRLVANYLEDMEAIRIESTTDLDWAVEEHAVSALLVNEASVSLTPNGLVEMSNAPFDIPIMSCWVPDTGSNLPGMGVEDYLVKPISRKALLDSIQHACPHARSILLVDDDREARQLFQRMLMSAGKGYTVLHAEDGETAIDLLQERLPDLLLLDLVMPNMDGFAVLEKKVAISDIKEIPVILITAKDPQREPIVSKNLTVTRGTGLSARDLMLAVRSITQVLVPRYSVVGAPETTGA